MTAAGVDSSEPVIGLRDVTRRFGAKVALDRVSLSVPRGVVFGLVGANGAGKTTLIRHVLGLLKAQTGSVRVFGANPVADPAGVLARIGYLSEENDLPGWMRVPEFVRYSRAFYPRWDDGYAEELRHTFELPAGTRICNLSKGQRARVGLLVALAHRPELLVLDEPSSGLDPLVRRDILEAVIRTIADEGRTVLFSSHLLDEVERVSDHVCLLNQGRIVFSAPLDELKESHRSLTVRFDAPQARPPALAGALAWKGTGHEWTAVCRGRLSDLAPAVAASGGRVVADRTPSLDEIFLAQVTGSKVPVLEG
ncbi:ABC transporter ATP-binding protein [Frigoriglobus tundricola]|uniref:ABC transporter, ATP-binding protein n=1 Tax=Frigoriglobus tundricola TaxID=2774151 RepID=A0A6M5YJA1_9BACT|nr:ABC transporter ATP-binding protein [Frigoriglobus tundricola]QJW93634.1 ABC transporter, ATP-binding protein [Frigoriglobus tundricola]